MMFSATCLVLNSVMMLARLQRRSAGMYAK